jgi:hypothetical protein
LRNAPVKKIAHQVQHDRGDEDVGGPVVRLAHQQPALTSNEMSTTER